MGLVAQCDFGTRTEGLVQDISVLNMNKRQMLERVRTELKETPEQNLQFAIAYKELFEN